MSMTIASFICEMIYAFYFPISVSRLSVVIYDNDDIVVTALSH